MSEMAFITGLLHGFAYLIILSVYRGVGLLVFLHYIGGGYVLIGIWAGKVTEYYGNLFMSIERDLENQNINFAITRKTRKLEKRVRHSTFYA